MPFQHVKSFFFFIPLLCLQLGFDLDREVYPLVVHAVVDEGDGNGTFCLLLLYTLPFCGAQAWQPLWPWTNMPSLWGPSRQSPQTD